MSIWFTSDSHYNHSRILSHANRPFSSIEEMNEALIKNWNSKVSAKDTVYHLGDFIMGNEPEDAISFILRLKGKIKFIFGNHDKALRRLHRGFEFCRVWNKIEFLGDLKTIKIDDQKIVLSHYAMRVWDSRHYGSWNLYGHSHGTLTNDSNSLSMDVGVDCHNYSPISLEEVKVIMSKKNFVPMDKNARKEGGGVGLSRDEYAKDERNRQYLALKKEFGD